jgi:hypothetical protein
MTATDAQVRIALRELQKGRTQEQAACRANLRSRNTVARYQRLGKLPSELRRQRTYRTRSDPFDGDWSEAEARLRESPTLEAKALFGWLSEREPGKYQEGQLRTFQRRVQAWKALHVDQVLSLPQVRRPGELMQLDGTWMNSLAITMGGQQFDHLLIHAVLPYSNWEWARVAQSESLMAIQLGLGSALEVLAYVPEKVQTDPSSAATHALSAHAENDARRTFNEDYLAFLAPIGITAVMTHRQSPDENGDVEAANGALKRAIEQELQLRGSRDFESLAAYEQFLFALMRRRNAGRQRRLNEELAVMAPLKVTLPPAVYEVDARVSEAGTVRVKNRPYSLPSSLKGRRVRAIVTEWQVEFRYAGRLIRQVPRRPGREPHIDYRDVVATLLKKPGGFRHYRYFDALFPRQVFDQAWEALNRWLSPRRADIAYLRLLNLAATHLEDDVAAALELLLGRGQPFDDETVFDLVQPPVSAVPTIDRGQVDLEIYDSLLSSARAA